MESATGSGRDQTRHLAEQLRSGWLGHGAGKAMLVFGEVMAYGLSLTAIVAAVLFVGVAANLAAVPKTGIVGMPAETFAAVIMVVQIILFAAAIGLFALGQALRASRKRRALVQRLCDAVLMG